MAMQVSTIPDTPFERRMAQGHRIRLGHELNAVHVSSDGVLWHKVNLCCGDSIPESVASWEELT